MLPERGEVLVEGLHPWWPAAVPIHPHVLFEGLGWMAAWQLFLVDRRRHDPVADPLTRATLLTIGVVGGALGAKLSPLFEDPAGTWAHRVDLAWLAGGRSIVGGLLGAWGAVELGKAWMGVRVATGDAYVRALGYGAALGRVGCFFSGVTDGTHGVPTDAWWGMDLGDGVPRHPMALFEVGFLAVATTAIHARGWSRDGDAFLAFLVSYLAYRLGVEAFKTQPFPYLGLSGIQVQCLVGLAACLAVALRRRRG